MSKKGNVKATIQDFLAKKLKKEEEQNKTLDIKISSMDTIFSVKKPSDEDILNFIEDLGDSRSAKKAITETMKLIYRNCPDLQNPELHEALEVRDPYDTMDVLFDFKDKQQIMEQFNKFIGFKADNLDEEVKK
ncbi:hypothetical protein [Clostridium sp.]|uniref:hypothetical protein n=1 Tax=Clostridium sp. TaxID=1506 RepID=UPI00261584CA|nr:hypothetical protein [Clostridium sp.]